MCLSLRIPWKAPITLTGYNRIRVIPFCVLVCLATIDFDTRFTWMDRMMVTIEEPI
jgi:hypothetical protein